MAIELHILTGSRAGDRPAFDKSVIAIGRHPACDLQFDPNQELLVSSRHAEVRDVGGRVTIRDVGSRNGTYVNGHRIDGEIELKDGDEIELGTDGPRLVARLGMSKGAVPRTSASADAVPSAARASGEPVRLNETLPPGGAAAYRPTQPKPSTEERVRVAVRSHTRWLRWALLAALVVLVVGVGGAYWMGHRESRTELEELRTLLTSNEVDVQKLLAQLDQIGDTAFANAMRRRVDSLRQRVDAQHAGTGGDVTELRRDLLQAQAAQQELARMDLRAISRANDSGVAFLVTEIAGTPYGSTAFGISPNGLLVTNRHNLKDQQGRVATRIAVKFANTSRFLHAKVVRMSDKDSIDLAILEIEEPGTYPIVSGIASSTAVLDPGSPVVTIGFPHSLDLPMEGETVKTSLYGGTVSKHLSYLLQVDAYAGHGSSGSPVFDARGLVVGVIWGGPAGSAGRITYAVPSEVLVDLLPAEARSIVR
jgi:pSer/pThr/pTyr-binding forkhead associated (FHA) protein/S1-C subfamily serine protease